MWPSFLGNIMTTQHKPHASTDTLSKRTNLIYRYFQSRYGENATIERSHTRGQYPMMRFSLTISFDHGEPVERRLERLVEDMKAKFSNHLSVTDESLGDSLHYRLILPTGYISISLNRYMIDPKKRIAILLM